VRSARHPRCLLLPVWQPKRCVHLLASWPWGFDSSCGWRWPCAGPHLWLAVAVCRPTLVAGGGRVQAYTCGWWWPCAGLHLWLGVAVCRPTRGRLHARCLFVRCSVHACQGSRSVTEHSQSTHHCLCSPAELPGWRCPDHTPAGSALPAAPRDRISLSGRTAIQPVGRAVLGRRTSLGASE
jgi:hypothetical protein